MNYNAVGSPSLSSVPFNTNHCCQGKREHFGAQPQKNLTVDARMVAEYYSSTSVDFTYTSKDGDTLQLSMESVAYGKSILEVAADGDQEDREKLIDFIKQSYDAMRKKLLDSFLRSVGEDVEETDSEIGTETVDESATLDIPEYWNAENTSQRIVDFALSFQSLYEGGNDEYLAMIKGAIEEGFKQAKEMLGELPDAVSGLIDDTYTRTMEKLDAWAGQQGIATAASSDEAAV